MNSRVTAAVGRALDERRREATEEVERILAAALTVIERAAPEPPRVSDIITEAGTSNKAFYRYFGGKDDLILAVMEHGLGLVASYLEHRMSKADDPAGKVACWIEGVLAQISEPQLARTSWALTAQFVADRRVTEQEMIRPLRTLLLTAVAALGTADPERDTDVVLTAVLGTMRRHLVLETLPGPEDVAHLVSFCLRGMGAETRD